MKPINRELLQAIRAAELDAKNHPSAPLLDAYSLHPDQIPPQDAKQIEIHLAGCERCRIQVEDTRSKRDFFSRQKTTWGDCE